MTWRTIRAQEHKRALDRMVQFAGQTKLDAGSGDYRADLADSLPDHSGQLWVSTNRLRSAERLVPAIIGRWILKIARINRSRIRRGQRSEKSLRDRNVALLLGG